MIYKERRQFGDSDVQALRDELQRHKRAIEWCLNNAARRARDDKGERCIMNADYDDVLSPPPDIADLIKGQS